LCFCTKPCTSQVFPTQLSLRPIRLPESIYQKSERYHTTNRVSCCRYTKASTTVERLQSFFFFFIMVSLWGVKKSGDAEGGQNEESGVQHVVQPGLSEADERTRLLPPPGMKDT